jgi:hypothetical protein
MVPQIWQWTFVTDRLVTEWIASKLENSHWTGGLKIRFSKKLLSILNSAQM